MSTIRYFERDGQRVELPPPSEIKTELRCDGCGEYLAKDDAAMVTVEVNFGIAVDPVERFQLHAHRAHARMAAVKVLGG